MVRERIDLSGLIKLDRNYPTDNSCVRKLKDKICDMAAENMEIKLIIATVQSERSTPQSTCTLFVDLYFPPKDSS